MARRDEQKERRRWGRDLSFDEKVNSKHMRVDVRMLVTVTRNEPLVHPGTQLPIQITSTGRLSRAKLRSAQFILDASDRRFSPASCPQADDRTL